MNVENLEFAFVNQLASSHGINPSGFLRSNMAGGFSLKRCRKCKIKKSLTEFQKNKVHRDKLHSWCKKCSSEYAKYWKLKNYKRVRTLRKQWRIKNTEKRREGNRLWNLRNPEKQREINKRWRLNNPEKIQEYSRRSSLKIRSTVKGNLDGRMSPAILRSLKTNKAGRRWEEILGYTVEDLKQHLESQFKNGMTWERFMNGEIHIDHKIPKSFFIYEKPEDQEFQYCWSLCNLQPLWAKDNQFKFTKIMR